MAMAFAIAGLRVPGLEIAEPQVVAKTWPGYWEMLSELTGTT
jgi:3-phosphoshikimate 1-carboxyvinyltransferase